MVVVVVSLDLLESVSGVLSSPVDVPGFFFVLSDCEWFAFDL